MQKTRPETLLASMLSEYPKLSAYVEDYLQGREEKAFPGWPDDVFLPFPAWMAIAGFYAGKDEPSMENVYEALRLETLGTWRYTKGIYRVSASLYDALTNTELPKQLPMRMFRKLPEACLYIECPVELVGGYGRIHGWFILLDYDFRSGAWELRIVEDNEQGHMFVAPFELTETLTFENSLAVYSQNAYPDKSEEELAEGRTMLLKQIEPAIKLLLYICQDEPEIDDEMEPHARPKYAQSKRAKGKVRIFEQPKARVWTVGKTLTATLDAQTDYVGTGSRKSPHIRRAHWHGTWSGARNGERKLSYRWQPPILVNEDLVNPEVK